MSIKKEITEILNKYNNTYSPELFLDKNAYADWLAQTYYFVRHSTSLLGYSMPHLKDDSLRHHFEQHLAEEKRHDLLALKDLSQLGYKITDFTEHTMTQAFYQSQYYRINFEGGTSLLGYILFLEGLAVGWGKNIYDGIKDTHGKSVLFLKVHAEEDPHHLESAIKTILSLSPSEQDAIMRNLKYSDEVYSSMITRIMQKKSDIKAA